MSYWMSIDSYGVTLVKLHALKYNYISAEKVSLGEHLIDCDKPLTTSMYQCTWMLVQQLRFLSKREWFHEQSRRHANSYMQQLTLCIPCDLMASANAPASVWLLEVSVSDNEQNMEAYELINGYKILLWLEMIEN